ncbi:MAG: carboxypeptidase-like regulatory domain-containing protein [bacterium]|jgi:hypothetical protein
MKRTILSIVLAVLFSISFAFAEGTEGTKSTEQSAQSVTISGNVIDMTTGEALTGVEVLIEGTDKKAYSDFDGNFSIQDLKPGEYNIIASFISYKKSLVENYTAESSNTINIKLQAD